MTEQTISITDVRLRLLDRPDSRDGLIGWASCVVNRSLYLNNIAVHRTSDGVFEVQYPSKPGRSGRRYYHHCPLNDEAREVLQRAILRHLSA